MRPARRWLLVVLCFGLLGPAVAGSPAARAQERADAEAVPAVFASGPWRVAVVAAVRSPGVNAVGLAREDGREWLVAVVDVTNWGDEDGDLPAAEFGLRFAGEESPAETGPVTATTTTDLNLRAGPSTEDEVVAVMPPGSTVALVGDQENDFVQVEFDGQTGWASASGLAVAAAAPATAPDYFAPRSTVSVAERLATEPRDADGGVAIGEGETVRFSLVFQIPADAGEPALVLGAGLPLGELLDAEADFGSLPEVGDPPELLEFGVDDVEDGATLQGFLPSEDSDETIRLLGVDAPVGDECFAGEAAERLEELAGETVYLEIESGEPAESTDALLRDVWVERDGGKLLLNQLLIAEGYAAAGFENWEGETRFRPWLEDAQRVAEAEERGLWGACTGPHGRDKPKPTPTPPPPTPTPSAEEARAGYTVLGDVRELAIRPSSFYGDEIAFSGEILTIQVAGPGDAFVLGDTKPQGAKAALQVWVTAPDGSIEAIFVGYDGDTTGMFEGTYVTVYGTVVDTQSGTNAFGGSITQPLVMAEIVDIG